MLIRIKKNILVEFFYFNSAVIALLVLAEIVWPNSVIAYVNINYVAVIWLASWLLLL